MLFHKPSVTQAIRPSHREKRSEKRLFSFFPGDRKNRLRAAELDLAPDAELAAAGCRGFTGPVPPPLSMRFVISTNTDRLIDNFKTVNGEFFGLFSINS
jgi:hypothetical protein